MLDIKKKRKTYIHCSHLKHSSLLLWLPSLPGRWAEPIQIPGVLCLAAWQAVPRGKALHSSSLDATCSQPSRRPPSPAMSRNSLNLAHSPHHEEPKCSQAIWRHGKQALLRDALLVHCYLTNTPLSNKSPSPLPKQIFSFVKNSTDPSFLSTELSENNLFITFLLNSRGGLWGFFQLSGR